MIDDELAKNKMQSWLLVTHLLVLCCSDKTISTIFFYQVFRWAIQGDRGESIGVTFKAVQKVAIINLHIDIHKISILITRNILTMFHKHTKHK